MSYMPELGQACYGQAWQQHECPQILDAALTFLRQELGRVLWNLKQEEWDPFGNRGEAFRCETFGVWAYDWSDDENRPQAYNFCYPKSGLMLSFYKYLGRGMSCNRDVDPAEVAAILAECMAACQQVEDGAMPYQVGSIGEVPYFDAVGV